MFRPDRRGAIAGAAHRVGRASSWSQCEAGVGPAGSTGSGPPVGVR